MKVEELTDKIVHVEYPTEYLLSSTFMRFQEYYESPKFKRKIFDIETFMDWYAEERGKFSYFTDWGGFNIPSFVLKPFYDGKFDPLTKKELRFLDIFEGRKRKFYIIGTYKDGEPAVLKHELCHAMFSTNPAYRKEVLGVLKDAPLKKLKSFLASDCYDKSVMLDEANAYITADFGYLGRYIPTANLREKRKELSRLFRQHCPVNI